jgi:hypothetical protein
MYGTEHPDLMRYAWDLTQLVALAALFGWGAEYLLRSDVRARGVPLLVGLLGLWAARWLSTTTGWVAGPTIAGHPIALGFAGALFVCGFLKMVTLGLASPRW